MIAKMKKLLLVGPQSSKESALGLLQKAGLVEIESYKGKTYGIDGRTVTTAKADAALMAIKIIDRYVTQAEKEGAKEPEDDRPADALVEEIPRLEAEYKKCKEHKTVLENKLQFLEPWGVFSLKDIRQIEEAGNVYIQFWDVSQKVADEVKIEGAIADIIVYQDNERKYFMTFAEKPLKIMKCIEVNYDTDPIELNEEIRNISVKEKEFLQSLLQLTRKREMLYRYYLENLNRVHFDRAARGTILHFDDRLFMLQAWCPEKDLEQLRQILENEPVTLIPVEAEKNERIPTQLAAKRPTDTLGSDLVNIYDTPSYKDWDPSTWLFLAFTVFFAMIMSDGGYGLLLLALMVYLKFRLKNPSPGIRRFVNLSMVLSGATAAYGLLSGGFFGLALDASAFPVLVPVADFLKQIRLLNTGDTQLMMMISIWIGMVHICISLVLKGLRAMFDDRDFVTPLINLAWIAGIWSFYFWYRYDGVSGMENYSASGLTGLQYTAGALVLFYAISARTLNPLKMFMTSFFGLYNGVQFFSDVLSYIRIFALGLSGSLLAQTFNTLSFDLWNAGFVGMIAAMVVWLLGHTLNVVLCIMGGVIHGLRLNFLEWYRWSFEGGGKRFAPFRDLLSSYLKNE